MTDEEAMKVFNEDLYRKVLEEAKDEQAKRERYRRE